MEQEFRQFDDQPAFDEVERIADAYLRQYIAGELDRLDVVYTRFRSIAKQTAVVETLLPLGSLTDLPESESSGSGDNRNSVYELIPSARSILERSRPHQFQGQTVQVFSGRGGQ